ncbi:DUF3836 domain-containing protein [Bacteroides heparinolyticus]|uniref:DUF3836 domain-containing protein n=1 Tax=Prevotella heparinolytica TaxID=28113 RepID=UPI0035A10445
MEFITAATIFLASLNVSQKDCDFAYNVETTDHAVTSQVVYKKDEGKYLSHHLKYNYTYDAQQRLKKKEVLKWNSLSGKWEQSHCLNYVYDMLGYSIEYALWNEKVGGYTDATAKQIYDESASGIITVVSYKWNKSDSNWVVQNNTVMMNAGRNLLSSLELNP